MKRQRQSMDLAKLRQKIASHGSGRFWRSLDELADTKEFREFLHREFLENASMLGDEFSRRKFMKLMGASLALAGVVGCTRRPQQKIVPYVRQPEGAVPGKRMFFATSFCLGGFATGVLVESHLGRPTKIEGNPNHPASLGATSIFAQASILDLYDPARSKTPLVNGQPANWQTIATRLQSAAADRPHGAGIRLLTQTVTSPSLTAQLEAFLKKFPEARWHQYEPINRDNIYEGTRLAFGEVLEPQYHFDKAEVVVSLDGDFLSEGPAALRQSRDFIRKRRIRSGESKMNRLYAIESMPTLAGAMADHRLPMRSGDIEAFAWALLSAIEGHPIAGFDAKATNWIQSLADNLKKSRIRSVIYAGQFQSPRVHALALLLNAALGNIGNTVTFIEPVPARSVQQMTEFRELVSDMQKGAVSLLLIFGGNPVYNAPIDLRFGEALSRIKESIHLSLFEDETSARCSCHVPAAHYLESWGDARAFDGTESLVQPLIAPLYDGKTADDILATVSGDSKSGYDRLREFWRTRYTGSNFEPWWRKSLLDGFIEGTAASAKVVSADVDAIRRRLGHPEARSAPSAGFELNLRPSPTLHDGEFATNAWLQELPQPLTQLVWDNAAFVGTATAEKLGLQNEDIIDVKAGNDALQLPVWIWPGHAADSITLTLGHGRTAGIGEGHGFNAYVVQQSFSPWRSDGVSIRKTGRTYPLVSTQHHHSMEGRDLVRSATLQEFLANPRFAQREKPAESLYPPFEYKSYAWGMVMDLNACIGCQACVIACQAENNIPVVGKDQVARGRKMHWLRVDHYFVGSLDNPEVYRQPVPCMHCENAPCELVCPVAATTHSAEGLNEMTYNRCIGTRYCSNNCPYKVRRFNFLQYSHQKIETLRLMHNPEVTVRARGVMEKCTYCVQRIVRARIAAKEENRSIRDGEIVPACAQVCPTEAIIFGDINDRQSQVAKLKAEPLNYALLQNLNTRPRTTYLAQVKNPNPALITVERS